MRFNLLIAALCGLLLVSVSCGGGSSTTGSLDNGNTIGSQASEPGVFKYVGTVPPAPGNGLSIVLNTSRGSSSKGIKSKFNGFGEAQGGVSGGGNYLDGSYDYIIDRDNPFVAHDYSEFHVEGVVTSADFNHRSSYLTIGLVPAELADAVLDGWDWPSYMFNQSAFLLCYERNGVLNIHPSDYNGSPYPAGAVCTVEPNGNGKYSFNFDLKFVPNGPMSPGGMMYLSINNGPYGDGVVYGYDNWEKIWGWNRLVEFYGTQGYGFDMSETYLVAQFYTENPDAYVSAHVNAKVNE